MGVLKGIRFSVCLSFCHFVNIESFHLRLCSHFAPYHNHQTMHFCGKVETEGSVLQELCHFVIPTDFNVLKRISTVDVTHEFRTNRMLTDNDHTPNGGLCPFCRVEIFEHAQNFPMNRQRRTRSGFIEKETEMKRYERTRTEEVFIRYSSVCSL